MKFLGLAALLILSACAGKQPALPVFGQIPRFELIDETGRPFDGKSLDGTVWVADFIFTTCTGPCPRMSSLMRQVQQAASSIPEVKLVSFTVDPEHDTPAVLAQYALRYHAQPERWHFLTGTREALDHLTRDAFKLGNVDGQLVHSTRLVLLDRQARIRGYYSTSEDSPVGQLVRDIKRVLAEKS
jgi:protein SCO1/2